MWEQPWKLPQMQRGEVTEEGSRDELGPLTVFEVEMLKQPPLCHQEPMDSPRGAARMTQARKGV